MIEYNGITFNSWKGRVKYLYLQRWLAHLENDRMAQDYLDRKETLRGQQMLVLVLIVSALGVVGFVAGFLARAWYVG